MRETQEFLRLVVHIDDTVIWVVGLVHITLIQNQNHKLHPIFPIYFEDIESGKENELLRLGNLKDFSNYVDACKEEVKKLR